ncbi:transcriptional regulator [Geovibrio thiophilus]|uniref:Transcriptional regulator n=1 Tax=Geovibrio thiophilus TaxID=139438 RepID=A0A410JWH8_9BACT|nr:type II toxin-antitoxin system Y4mF family antitoxin [Geovibrio thiophilus]QAR32409.1 transcriptional regulator [Geovibrio thiophilus]
MELAEIIKDARKAAGLTQKELAEHAGVAKNLIYDLEKGKMTIRYENILKVLHILNIKVKYISPLGSKDA